MDFELGDEHQFIRQTVRDFVQKELAPRAKQIDASGEFPHDVFKQMGELGLLGLPFPEQYGGADGDTLSVALATEEIARGCGSSALAYAAHVGLGSMPIFLFGTEDQKQRFLVPAARGEYLAAFGLTEPQAGSDAAATRTRAYLEADKWVINGEKMWITNAPIAGHLIVTAVTDQEQGKRGISSIIVPRGTPGLSFGKHEHKMGLHGSMSTAVFLNDVRVPQENLLGERGKGLAQFLQILDGGRITIGAMAIGLAQAAMEASVAYAREREAFGRPIGAFQSVSNMIADMAVGLEASRLLIYKAAVTKDRGASISQIAAIAKLYATEISEKICRDAIQIHGGYGYSSEFPVERYYRDTRLLTIGEGTSEIQRMVIARHELGSLAAQL